MKTGKLFCFGLIFSFLATACSFSSSLPYEERIALMKNEQYQKPEDISYFDLDYADYTNSVILSEAKQKIENQEDLVLFFYSDGCEHCHQLKPQFIKYICETKYIFTSINCSNPQNNSTVYSQLFAQVYPDIFPETRLTPSFYFIKNGVPVASQIGLSTKQMKNYSYFCDFMDGYVKPAQ